MIIATIGNAKLQIETLKDAEALLDITNRSTLIGTSYDENYRNYQYVDEGEKRVTIEITEGNRLLSFDEHRKIEQRLAEKMRLAKEAAEAAAANPVEAV